MSYTTDNTNITCSDITDVKQTLMASGHGEWNYIHIHIWYEVNDLYYLHYLHYLL